MLEEGITELASDVVEDLSGTAETVAENLKVSTLAADARLKALVLISDANLEGVRVEVIGSGNLGGKNGRRRKEGRLLRGTVSETWTPSLSSRGRNARRRDARGQRRGTCGQQRETRGRQRGTCGQQKGRAWSTKGTLVVNMGTHVADEGRRMVQNGTHMLQKGTHMVNRAYLYSLDNRPVSYFDRPERASGLSEWPGTVPISYRILASGNTQICSSLIANGLEGAPDVKVYAINGEYDVGFARFLRFIDVIRFVSGSSHFEAPKLLDETISTRSFLDLHMNKYVQLETVELDILSGGDEAMMREMVEAEASMCTWIGESIDALPSETNEAAAVVYESSVKGAGPFAGLRFDDKYDAGRDPLGFRWSETLNFDMPTRAEFEETEGRD